MPKKVHGFFYARKEKNLKIILTETELLGLIIGLELLLVNCTEQIDLFACLDDDDELEKLNEVMKVSTLLKRLIDLYKHNE